MNHEVRRKNYYDVLEVPTNAPPDDIHNNYNRSRNAYAQDSAALYSLMSNNECQEMLALLDEAYSVLGDPAKRQEYDIARGITNVYNPMHDLIRPMAADNFKRLLSDPMEQKQVTPGQAQNITKLVATKRFSLEFTPDTAMETEIEQTSEFTGAFLKKIREYKKVDINRMADMTKVAPTHLKNIEEEEFSKLPATVYVRGFVYQYAKCLKLNPDLVTNSFMTRMKLATQSPSKR